MGDWNSQERARVLFADVFEVPPEDRDPEDRHDLAKMAAFADECRKEARAESQALRRRLWALEAKWRKEARVDAVMGAPIFRDWRDVNRSCADDLAAALEDSE